MVDGEEEIFKAYQSVFECLGVTCDDIGELGGESGGRRQKEALRNYARRGVLLCSRRLVGVGRGSRGGKRRCKYFTVQHMTERTEGRVAGSCKGE